jgi:hypothetical protein
MYVCMCGCVCVCVCVCACTEESVLMQGGIPPEPVGSDWLDPIVRWSQANVAQEAWDILRCDPLAGKFILFLRSLPPLTPVSKAKVSSADSSLH